VKNVLVGSLLGLSCASVPLATTNEPSPVVVSFGYKKIRLAEVDLKARDELMKLNEQIYDLRVETAEQLAIESMVKDKAKTEGTSESVWLESKLQSQPPSDDEVRAIYDRLKPRIPPGKTFDDVKDELAKIVEKDHQSKKAKALFTQLKRESNFKRELKAPARVRIQVDSSGPVRGSPDAKVTIVEFADFQCSFCVKSVRTVESVLKNYDGKVKLVFKHFPLSFHEKAPKAAEAAACADDQGRFWALHDMLFDTQELDIESLKKQAANLGLDVKKFDECLDSGRKAEVVKRDMFAGQKASVSGTPAFFINGISLSGARPEDEFVRIIEEELGQ
jgi:protein-disulfide isomerase